MSKRFTKEIFVKKAEERYGEGAYDYSLVTYINSRTPVTIICSVHGPFQQNLEFICMEQDVLFV